MDSVETLSIKRLSDSQREDWRRIRAASPLYRQPFYSFEFLDAVDSVGSDVSLGVQQGTQGIEAILAFHRHGTQGKPAGAGINDAHGILARTPERFDVDAFLRGCNLSNFTYHSAHPEMPGVKESEIARTRSFLADLKVHPDGYETFLRNRNRTIDKQGQKTRKLARQEGKLEFEFDCREPKLIAWLIAKKRAQYQRTHTFDIFSLPWIQHLLTHLHQMEHSTEAVAGSKLRGLMSVLYAGGNPVAAHYGLIEGDQLHYWFPVYDEQFHYGSPGTQLFLDVAKEAVARGFSAIDMGYGEQAYKHKLTNVVTEMSIGTLGISPFSRAISKASLAIGEQIKSSRWRNQLKPLARKAMPWIGKGKYQ